MRIHAATTLSLALLLGLSACRKETPAEDKDKAAEATASAKAAESSDEKGKVRSKARADEGIEVPTEEDFEDTAEQQITPESDLKKELDQIEKEIEK